LHNRDLIQMRQGKSGRGVAGQGTAGHGRVRLGNAF